MSGAGDEQHPTTESIRFSSAAFDLDTIKKAAYRFLDRFSTDFRVEGDEIVCIITFLRPTTPEAVHSTIAEFRAEVLDQDLRRKVAGETSAIRNAILALAFSPSKLNDRE